MNDEKNNVNDVEMFICCDIKDLENLNLDEWKYLFKTYQILWEFYEDDSKDTSSAISEFDCICKVLKKINDEIVVLYDGWEEISLDDLAEEFDELFKLWDHQEGYNEIRDSVNDEIYPTNLTSPNWWSKVFDIEC